MIARLLNGSGNLPIALLLIVASFIILIQQLSDRGQLVLLAPLVIVCAGLILIARFPWFGFALLIISVPFQRFGSEGAALPVTFTQLVFPVAIGGYLITMLVKKRPARGHIVLLPFTALILVMLASAVTAQSPGASFAEISRWLVALVAFWLALQYIVGESEHRLMAVVVVLTMGGVFEATVGLVQSVIGFGPFEVGTGVSRAFGTFGRPNSYAGFLEMTLFPSALLVVWYARQSHRRFQRYVGVRHLGMARSRPARRHFYVGLLALVLFAMATGIILSGIVASLSRGAWLGVTIGATVTALLLGPVSRLITIILLVSSIGLAASGQSGILPESFRERITTAADQIRPFDARTVPITDENFAAAERVAHWQTGLAMYRDHPVLGVGIGNFNTRFEEFSIRETFRVSQGHAHNYYIHTLAETGLLGLLAYLTLLGSIIVLGLRVLISSSNNDSFSRMAVLGAFGSIVAISTHNLFEDLHVLNLGIVISVLWAIVIAGHQHWQSEIALALTFNER